MTALTPRTVIIDGIRLDSFAYAITSRTGWESTPGLAGSNLRVPGKDGEVWQAKDYGPGRVVLDLFVQGTNADGEIPVGSTAEKTFRSNIDSLLATFSKRSSLITVDKEIEDGSVRRNFAEVGTVIQPDYFDGDTLATFTVELIFPDPLWKATTTTTSTGVGALSAFAGITAPISDAVITVAGPATNPKITDVASGAWIQYTGTVASGSSWVIDCAAFSSKIGATSVIAATTFNPGPRFFSLTPSTSLVPSITLSSGASISIVAARRFIA
jgi:hypothetical protein